MLFCQVLVLNPNAKSGVVWRRSRLLYSKVLLKNLIPFAFAFPVYLGMSHYLNVLLSELFMPLCAAETLPLTWIVSIGAAHPAFKPEAELCLAGLLPYLAGLCSSFCIVKNINVRNSSQCDLLAGKQTLFQQGCVLAKINSQQWRCFACIFWSVGWTQPI